MFHRLAPEAEADLDATWFYVATDSGSAAIADRLIDSITSRFLLLAQNPYLGRRRDDDLRPGIRTLAVNDFVIAYRVTDEDAVLILRVLRGSRDIEALLGA